MAMEDVRLCQLATPGDAFWYSEIGIFVGAEDAPALGDVEAVGIGCPGLGGWTGGG